MKYTYNDECIKFLDGEMIIDISALIKEKNKSNKLESMCLILNKDNLMLSEYENGRAQFTDKVENAVSLFKSMAYKIIKNPEFQSCSIIELYGSGNDQSNIEEAVIFIGLSDYLNNCRNAHCV